MQVKYKCDIMKTWITKRILNFGSMGYHATLDFVRKRDKNTCRKCGKKWLTGHRRFDVHHLNEFEGSGKLFVKITKRIR